MWKIANLPKIEIVFTNSTLCEKQKAINKARRLYNAPVNRAVGKPDYSAGEQNSFEWNN